MSTTDEALGYIDKTIDNVIDIPATVWRSDEVIEMLRELRSMIVTSEASRKVEVTDEKVNAADDVFFERIGQRIAPSLLRAALSAALGGGDHAE